MASSRSLIFLPDISGFTNFVNQTESDHAQHIISELLEILIDSNELNLSLAEIEGDALFYFKYQDFPSPEALLSQIRKMYLTFHNHLRLYETRRICNCGSCTSAMDLTVKFIVHAGDFNFIKVKDSEKPFGKDIILAHRLMKNNVPIDDYALISQHVYDTWDLSYEDNLDQELQHIEDSYTYEDAGKVDFVYLDLNPIREHVTNPPPLEPGARVDNPIVYEAVIPGARPEVFELVSNFEYRLLFNTSLDSLDYDKEKVNRAGTKHSCVINGQYVEQETLKSDFGEGKWVYGEKTTDIPLVNEASTFFILEEDGQNTRLRIEAHLQPSNFLGKLFIPIFKKKLKKSLVQAMEEIKQLASETPLHELLHPHTEKESALTVG